jgi:putative endonuclease
MGREWFVYVTSCSDGSLYTGVTTDPARRLREHNTGKGGAYTRSRRPLRLVFKEAHPNRSSALKREAQIKRWAPSRKRALVVGYPVIRR